MTTIELTLSDDLLERLQSESVRRNMPVAEVVNVALEQYFEDDEPSDEEILESIRQSMIEVLAGRVRPVDEVLAELKQEFDFNADES